MVVSYMVKAFVPKVAGCGAKDAGWDTIRCNQFEKFVNSHAIDGWRLHSSEYRQVTIKGCGGGNGAWLVCTFEKQIDHSARDELPQNEKTKYCTGCGDKVDVDIAFCDSCGKKQG